MALSRLYNYEDKRLNQQFDVILSLLEKTKKEEARIFESLFITIPAFEPIPILTPVTSTGRIAKSIRENFGRVVGITYEQFIPGRSGKVLHKGLISNLMWNFAPGSIIYLDKEGALTDIYKEEGYFVQVMGKAISTNLIYIDIGIPVLL